MSLGSDIAHAHCAERSCDCSRDIPVWLLENTVSICEGEWGADTGIQRHTGAAGPSLFLNSQRSGAPARDSLAQCLSSVIKEMCSLSLASCKSGRCLRKEPVQRTAPCLFLLPLRKVRLQIHVKWLKFPALLCKFVGLPVTLSSWLSSRISCFLFRCWACRISS